MLIVVDANPLISILIKPGKPIDLLFRDELELAAPELLFEEINNNKSIIISKSGLSKNEIDGLILILKERIKVFSEQEFFPFRQKAIEICPDPKDVAYFALALNLNCPIWSNEKKLKEQKEVKVYATHDLIGIFCLN